MRHLLYFCLNSVRINLLLQCLRFGVHATTVASSHSATWKQTVLSPQPSNTLPATASGRKSFNKSGCEVLRRIRCPLDINAYCSSIPMVVCLPRSGLYCCRRSRCLPHASWIEDLRSSPKKPSRPSFRCRKLVVVHLSEKVETLTFSRVGHRKVIRWAKYAFSRLQDIPLK